jgi:hypothetical protein
MKIHSTNYTNTFIEVAEDCPAPAGEVPPAKGAAKTVAGIQYELLREHPYRYTSDEVLFRVYAIRNDLSEKEWAKARVAFFSKGQPCFRASPLAKRYGWGIHCDKDGRIALYGRETEAYEKLAGDKSGKVLKAMKSAR